MKLQAADVPDDREIATVYIVAEREMMIDAPLETVWRHALNYPSWQNYSVVKHICGEPGHEGEVVLLKKEELDIPTASYYARTIKLDPLRRVVWKTYRENVNYFGIVDFRFYEMGSKTRFWNNSLYEHHVPYREESEVEDFRRQAYANVDRLFSSILPRLKELAEQNV